MLWLSCITMFSPLLVELKDVKGSSSALTIGRFHIYAYTWSIITSVSGFYLKEVLVDKSQPVTFLNLLI